MRTSGLENRAARGTLAHLDFEITLVLRQELPCGISPEMAKPELALYWLSRPNGFWARLRWAWGLVWRKAS